MPSVTFYHMAPGDRLIPGSRVRTVWLLTSLGQLSAAVNPFADSTDQVNKGAQDIISGVTARGLGYVTNVPPAIVRGDLGVVLDIRLSSSGPVRTAAELATFLEDLPGVGTIRLDRLGPIPSGESAQEALQARQEATQAATTEAQESLPTGVLAGAADSVGGAAKQVVRFVQWGAVLVLVVLVFWAWRTYGPRGRA